MGPRRIGRILSAAGAGPAKALFSKASLLQLFIATRQLGRPRRQHGNRAGNWLYISEFIQ
jgi:hypothetical protein